MPDAFRFAAKLPKAITHERRLVDGGELLATFAAEVGGLGDKLGAILVQLPPSLALDPATASGFFHEVTRLFSAGVVCEPRHPSWFTAEADSLLVSHRVARAAADPARVPAAALPGGWPGLAYARWHGSPATYRSSYAATALAAHATLARSAAVETWTIYDNTTLGAATANALALGALLDGASGDDQGMLQP